MRAKRAKITEDVAKHGRLVYYKLPSPYMRRLERAADALNRSVTWLIADLVYTYWNASTTDLEGAIGKFKRQKKQLETHYVRIADDMATHMMQTAETLQRHRSQVICLFLITVIDTIYPPEALR